jgi:hypothetical protein
MFVVPPGAAMSIGNAGMPELSSPVRIRGWPAFRPRFASFLPFLFPFILHLCLQLERPLQRDACLTIRICYRSFSGLVPRACRPVSE